MMKTFFLVSRVMVLDVAGGFGIYSRKEDSDGQQQRRQQVTNTQAELISLPLSPS